jgi:hypothetical protein
MAYECVLYLSSSREIFFVVFFLFTPQGKAFKQRSLAQGTQVTIGRHFHFAFDQKIPEYSGHQRHKTLVVRERDLNGVDQCTGLIDEV